MLSYLRIVVTALSVTACVLFVALWVRSSNYTAEILNVSCDYGNFSVTLWGWSPERTCHT